MRKLLIGIMLACLIATASVALGQTPTEWLIRNPVLTLAATEYSIDLGQGIKAFSVQLRGSYDLRVAISPGATATNYTTVKSGNIYISPSIKTWVILYLRCDGAAGQIVEVEAWR